MKNKLVATSAGIGVTLLGTTILAFIAQPLRGQPLLSGFRLSQIVSTPTPYSLSPSGIPMAQFSAAELQTPSTAAPIAGLYLGDRSPNSTAPQAAFPLKHTDVQATIQGNVARVELTQTFENPFDEPLEAVYVFPLPDEAAVDDMEILVGDRRIKGDIKRREEAQEIYEQAISEGRTAGLLEQERANIFTQSLANIRPGEQIEVTIRYSESLQFEGNNYEFVLPMVVGPRYIPGNPTTEAGDTDQVPDAARITPPVLPPGTRSGHDIAVTLTIDAGVPIQTVESPSHKIQITPNANGNQSQLQLQLAPNDTVPNKDLIVRYQVAGATTQTTVLTDTTDQGGHFALYLIPAVDYATDEIVPKDVVFLMDTSGSQSGDPLAKSQELMRRMVAGLNPDDTFTIIDFANTTTRLSPNPLANTASNRTLALNYINQLSANGGTELLNGIQEVLRFPAAERDRLRSIVLITDGYIGNEAAVIAEVQGNLAAGNRLYSFGVGSGVNRFLIDRLAEVGRGTAQVIRQDEPTEAAAERFFQQINNPVLTNIEVEWVGDGTEVEVYPSAAPDLFANQPLVIFGRKADQVSGQIRVTGTMAGGDRYQQLIPVNFDQPGTGAIAQLWGRSRIKDLMNQMYSGETVSGVEVITQTALDYRLLSQYTAFVAVSEEVRVDPDGTRRTVQVPVELPEGVSYEGIFGDSDEFAVNSPPRFSNQAALMAPPSPSVADRSRSGYRLPAAPGQVYGIGGNSGQAPAPLDPSLSTETVDDGLALEPDTPDTPDVSVSIVSLDGSLAQADQTELERQLRQHLQQTYYAYDSSGGNWPTGTLVWRVRLQNGRVVQVLWDDQRSSLTDESVVEQMRRSLQSWSTGANVPALTTTLEITVEP